MSVAAPPAPPPLNAAEAPPHTTHAERSWQPDRFLRVWLLLALAIAALPSVLAACCAPPGATGLGTVWFVNDFAQYESAMRQGAQRADWLVYDPFTAEPHAPAFMFPLYVGLGKLAALLRLPPGALLGVTSLLARALFVVALWRFVRRFALSQSAARAAFLLALFGGGLGFLVGIVGAILGRTDLYVGNWSYETNTFGLLFAAPHVPLAMAATLELAAWLVPPPASRRAATWRQLAVAALLGAVTALLHPFHLPVLLGVLGLAGLVWGLSRAGWGTFLVAAAAGLGALPVLLPTVLTFTLDPFWGATYTVQNLLPSPAPHELFVDLGATLLLALGGAWFCRGRVGPFGLVLWLLLTLVAMYLPVPYQRRLSFGAAPALAVLAGNSLVLAAELLRPRALAALRLGTLALAGGGTLLVLLSVALSGVSNTPLVIYRSTADLDAAADWLNQHAQPDEVILADWDVDNYLAPRTPARVFGGHPVATLQQSEKRFLTATLLAHGGNPELARRLGATWVVFGPDEAPLPDIATPAYQSGPVRVFRVQG